MFMKKGFISKLGCIKNHWIHVDKWIPNFMKINYLDTLNMCPIIGYMDSLIYVDTCLENEKIDFRMRVCLKFLDSCG